MLQFDCRLEAKPRSDFGKVLSKKMRAQGLVPAVLYSRSKKGESESIAIEAVDANRLVNDYLIKSRVVELSMGGKSRKALLKDVEFDPITDLPNHIDFMEIEMGDEVEVLLPVRVINADQCVGIKRGGDVFVLHYGVPVQIKVSDRPSEILIDVAGSMIGQRFKLSEVLIPEGGKIKRDMLIAKIVGRKSSGGSGANAANEDSAAAAEPSK